MTNSSSAVHTKPATVLHCPARVAEYTALDPEGSHLSRPSDALNRRAALSQSSPTIPLTSVVMDSNSTMHATSITRFVPIRNAVFDEPCSNSRTMSTQ